MLSSYEANFVCQSRMMDTMRTTRESLLMYWRLLSTLRPSSEKGMYLDLPHRDHSPSLTQAIVLGTASVKQQVIVQCSLSSNWFTNWMVTVPWNGHFR